MAQLTTHISPLEPWRIPWTASIVLCLPRLCCISTRCLGVGLKKSLHLTLIIDAIDLVCHRSGTFRSLGSNAWHVAFDREGLAKKVTKGRCLLFVV